MGNTTSLLNEKACEGFINPKTPLEDQIKHTVSRQHPYFGNIQLWSQLQSREEKIFSKIFYGSDEVEKDIMVSQHDYKSFINHTNLLKYYGCSFYEKYELTMNMVECHSFYEYPTLNLHQVVEHHKHHLNTIREPKLLEVSNNPYYIQSMMSSLTYLQSKALYHGDLNPESIFVNKKTNTCKILFHDAIIGIQTGYAKTLAYDGKGFLSPQLIKCLQSKTLKPQQDWIKSDIYALGMTILELISQKSSYDCYDFPNFTIKEPLIQQRLQEASNDVYSGPFINLIQGMLHQDEQKRLDLATLISKLNAVNHIASIQTSQRLQRSSQRFNTQHTESFNNDNRLATMISSKVLSKHNQSFDIIKGHTGQVQQSQPSQNPYPTQQVQQLLIRQSQQLQQPQGAPQNFQPFIPQFKLDQALNLKQSVQLQPHRINLNRTSEIQNSRQFSQVRQTVLISKLNSPRDSTYYVAPTIGSNFTTQQRQISVEPKNRTQTIVTPRKLKQSYDLTPLRVSSAKVQGTPSKARAQMTPQKNTNRHLPTPSTEGNLTAKDSQPTKGDRMRKLELLTTKADSALYHSRNAIRKIQ